MSRISHTAEGFRATFHRPSVVLAEVVWRWLVGSVAVTLLLFSVIEYLRSVPVTGSERLVLRATPTALWASLLAHILHGSLPRVILAGLLASLGLGGIWIVTASLGRSATVRELLEYFAFRRKSSHVYTNDWFRPILQLNFLRAAILLAAVLGLLGAAIMAGFSSPDANPHPGRAILLFIPLAGLVCLIAWFLNWMLSLASIFPQPAGDGAIDAIAAAVALCRERTGGVFAVSTWTALAHLFAFVAAAMAGTLALSFVAVAHGRLFAVATIGVALAYFAVADWLYVARLAGYMSILEIPENSVGRAAIFAPVPFSGGITPTEALIDRGEPILSDCTPEM